MLGVGGNIASKENKISKKLIPSIVQFSYNFQASESKVIFCVTMSLKHASEDRVQRQREKKREREKGRERRKHERMNASALREIEINAHSLILKRLMPDI